MKLWEKIPAGKCKNPVGEIGLILFLLLLPLIFISVSNSLYVRGQAVSSFLAFSVFFIASNIRLKSDFISNFILVLLWQGIVVGGFYVIIGTNSMSKFFDYTMIMLLTFFAYNSGRLMATSPRLLFFIFLLAAADALMSIPLALKGNLYRTSVGTTNLLPMLLIIVANPSLLANRKFYYLAITIVLLVIGGLAYLTSGLRSALGVLSLSTILIVLYLGRNVYSRARLLRSVMCGVCFCGLTFWALPDSFKNIAMSRIEVVQTRLGNTLLREDGVKLDEKKESGRTTESSHALAAFEVKNGVLKELVGYGNGFVFVERNEETAHIHLSIVAYYIRYGIVGVLFYILLVFMVVIRTVQLFLPNMKKNGVALVDLGLCLSALQVIVISFIAGSLTYSINVCIIGLALGYRSKMDRQL